jgi:hypothetical protein
MLLAGSENAGVGFADGMRILRAGGRALDAVTGAGSASLSRSGGG